MTIFYSPRVRIERIIILSRVALASFSLLAVWLDPFEPQVTAVLTYNLLAVYLGYALFLVPVFWRFPLIAEKMGMRSHIFDIIGFTMLVAITEGSTRPFFTYFVFTLFCAALRWQKEGIIMTALAFLCFYASISISLELARNDPDFQLNRFIIRNVNLVTIALLLVFLTTYEKRVREELNKLSNWPYLTQSLSDPEKYLGESMAYASDVMNAPRALMIWEEREEPIGHIAYLSQDGFLWRQISPGVYEPLIDEAVASGHFLCRNAAETEQRILHTDGKKFEYVTGLRLHPDLIQHYNIGSVIGLSIEGQEFRGILMFLDKQSMIPDDLTLGILVAHQISALTDQLYSYMKLQKAAASEERVKMARDLHDGLLQTLTGIALQVETIRRTTEKETPPLQKSLGELQSVIAAEQRELRGVIGKLKPAAIDYDNVIPKLDSRFQNLTTAIKQQWGLEVSISMPSIDKAAPQSLQEEIYSLVREALINSDRHAQATHVQAVINFVKDGIYITISDDGRGFPFQGRYGLADLEAMHQGPKSIKERISALEGRFSINSGTNGAILDMFVPFKTGNSFSEPALDYRG
ncbi:MAG: sensor histidine kinase [Gammaproteobacteria bacterium]